MTEIKFETALGRLEEIVGLIETGKLDLDDTIKIFEEGMHLAVHCQKALSKADEKIKQLIVNETNGEMSLIDFAAEEL